MSFCVENVKKVIELLYYAKSSLITVVWYLVKYHSRTLTSSYTNHLLLNPKGLYLYQSGSRKSVKTTTTTKKKATMTECLRAWPALNDFSRTPSRSDPLLRPADRPTHPAEPASRLAPICLPPPPPSFLQPSYSSSSAGPERLRSCLSRTVG